MATVLMILVIITLITAILSLMNWCPLSVPVLLLSIVELLRVLPLK